MEWTKPGAAGPYGGIPGMDPWADWLLGPGLYDFLPHGEEALIPVIVRLGDQTAVDLVKGLIAGDGPSVFVTKAYAGDLKPGGAFTGFATKALFDGLAEEGGRYAALRGAAKEIKLCAPQHPASLPGWKPGGPIPELAPPPVKPRGGGWDSRTVVVGVIDDGIAFGHGRFRDAAGRSRVECFWRQDGPYDPVSSTVDFGSEICKADGPAGKPGIDTLLAAGTVGGAVDEALLYRRAGLIDFAEPGHKAAAWRLSHGTHVLDLAAGADPACDVTTRPIVCVQLPVATTADTSGADLADKIIRGADYILERADAMAGPGNRLPVVINCSYGLIAGPHDGTSLLERALDDRVRDRAGMLRIVLPAGNSHQSRCHARMTFERPGQVAPLRWRVQPDDRTPSFLQVWLPYQAPQAPAADRIRLSVVTPWGLESPLIGETHNTGVHLIDNGEVICTAHYAFSSAPTLRGLFCVALQPTARLRPTTPPQLANRIAPSGAWTVKLHNVSLGAAEPVEAWIQRDDTIYGYPRLGRQSYFDEPCYARFDAQGREIEEDSHLQLPPCHVRRAGLVNGIATGARTVVAGGFLRKDLRPATYSAGGPITLPPGGNLDPAGRKPDAMLVSSDSKVHAGLLAAGTSSGSVVAMGGTSVGAPQLARWLADHLDLQTAVLPDRDAVKVEAQAQEAGYPASKPALPPDRGGWGRITLDPIVPLPRYED